MQLRFDGTLGFPGGLVDPGETLEEAATREMREELGGGVTIRREDHVISSYSKETKFCCHFYARQISMEKFRELENGITQSKDWGVEVNI